MGKWKTVIAALTLSLFQGHALAEPAALPAPDGPELSALGDFVVGARNVELVQLHQADPFRSEDETSYSDRHLRVRLWYPASTAGDGIVYRTGLPGEDNEMALFDVEGIASPDVPPAPGKFPLVVLAHGYSNSPEALVWLGENLASKGYVVAAPAFNDPPINIRTDAARAGPLARRPLDIAFVASRLQSEARAEAPGFAMIDADRLALVGYSMGGYGVLTAAGAPLSPAMADKTNGVLAPFVSDGPRQNEIKVSSLRAVVAIAPPSGLGGNLWAAPGVGAITAPTLYIAGDQDHVVGYDKGVRPLFQSQSHADRYLLTFKGAAHSIALIGAPPEMRQKYWDFEWFEDAVWRKDRLLDVQKHFITAFLDRYVKDDISKQDYTDGLIVEGAEGVWESAPGGRYAGYSPGSPEATLWKGFQKGKANGMSFESLKRAD